MVVASTLPASEILRIAFSLPSMSLLIPAEPGLRWVPPKVHDGHSSELPLLP